MQHLTSSNIKKQPQCICSFPAKKRPVCKARRLGDVILNYYCMCVYTCLGGDVYLTLKIAM